MRIITAVGPNGHERDVHVLKVRGTGEAFFAYRLPDNPVNVVFAQ